MRIRPISVCLLGVLLALPLGAAGEDAAELRRALERQETLERFWAWQQELQREASATSGRTELQREIRDAASDRRALGRALAFERRLLQRARRVELQGESVRPIEDALRHRDQQRQFESRQRSLQRRVLDRLDQPTTSVRVRSERVRTRTRSPFSRGHSSGRGIFSRR